MKNEKIRNKANLIPYESLEKAADCLKCIAHPVRLRMIELLLGGKYTVDEIADVCGVQQPVASGHLRLLHSKGLFECKRIGRKVYYQVAELHLKDVFLCVESRFRRSLKS